MLTYVVEQFEDFEDELKPLLPAQYAEFDIYGPPFENTPNFAAYRAMSSAKLLSAVTARDDGYLVGYWLGVICPDLHHSIGEKPVIGMSNAAFYIRPEYRAKCAKAFFAAIEEHATARGAALLGQRIRPGDGSAANFMKAIGYHEAEIMMVKPIGKAAECRISG